MVSEQAKDTIDSFRLMLSRAENTELHSGVAALRAELADLRNEVEILHSRIAYLESRGRR